MIFEIYSPESPCLKGEAKSIVFPCTDGELCVMDGHMPLAASLGDGILKIRSDGDTVSYRTGSGFTEVRNNTVIIYVNKIERI